MPQQRRTHSLMGYQALLQLGRTAFVTAEQTTEHTPRAVHQTYNQIRVADCDPTMHKHTIEAC